MLLCIDIGNTQTVYGLFEERRVPAQQGHTTAATDGLVEHFRVSTNSNLTSDEHGLQLSQLLSMVGHNGTAGITGAVLSATNSSVGAAVVEMIRRWYRVEPLVVDADTAVGLQIEYRNPKDVGADRIADAVGVLDLYGGPSIVVDFGTATTFDAVSSDGRYLGGAIAPGVAISVDALYLRAAALRQVKLVEPPSVIGKTTSESVQSGVLYGFAAMVDGVCRRMIEVIGQAKVVGTGGLSSLITPYSMLIDTEEPWLTLHGLRLIFERCKN
jgi:type III pantothenate kinase